MNSRFSLVWTDDRAHRLWRAFGALFLGVWTALSIGSIIGGRDRPIPIAIVVFGFFAVAQVTWSRRVRLLKGVREVLDKAMCPRCHYPLCDVPSALEPGLLDNMIVGPRHCHECGCEWPLVPSPYAMVEW